MIPVNDAVQSHSQAEVRKLLRKFVYIAYTDDSGSTGRNLSDRQSPIQVITSVLVKEHYFDAVEYALALTSFSVIDMIPHERRESFEFHAADLFHGQNDFKKVAREKCHEVISVMLSEVSRLELPVIYGAANKVKLQTSHYGDAHPITVAFRVCAEELERWFDLHTDTHERGLVIADDTRDLDAKQAIKRSFRQYRRRLGPALNAERGLMAHFLDDMYFGDSSDSVGLQIADLCAFFVTRHLNHKEDTEYFFRMIEKNVHGRTVPE